VHWHESTIPKILLFEFFIFFKNDFISKFMENILFFNT
jgi:hypothetical protein